MTPIKTKKTNQTCIVTTPIMDSNGVSLIPAVSVAAGVNYDTKTIHTQHRQLKDSVIEGLSLLRIIFLEDGYLSQILCWIALEVSKQIFNTFLTLTHSFNPKWVDFWRNTRHKK